MRKDYTENGIQLPHEEISCRAIKIQLSHEELSCRAVEIKSLPGSGFSIINVEYND